MEFRPRRFLALVFAICLGLAPLPPAHAENPLDYEVKAAFLYNFARFIEWPAESFENPRAPFLIGVLGEHPFRDALDRTTAGKTIDQRPVEVIYGRRLEDLDGVHLLFISESEQARVGSILEELRGRSVLTVSDIPRFTQNGGIIRFFFRDRRVAFQINIRAAERANLRLSARLLHVADIYRE